MGQLQRGSKDENVCPLLGDWVCLGKAQGCPGSSAPRGGEAHSRHRRRRVGASTRSPRSPGTARWSWSWLERWTSGRGIFHRTWKWRLGLERGSWRRQLPALGHVQPLQPILPASLLRPPAPPARENSCPRLRVQRRPRGSWIPGWAGQRAGDSQEGSAGRAGTPTLAIPQTTTDSGPSKRQALFSTLTSFKSESVEKTV